MFITQKTDQMLQKRVKTVVPEERLSNFKSANAFGVIHNELKSIPVTNTGQYFSGKASFIML